MMNFDWGTRYFFFGKLNLWRKRGVMMVGGWHGRRRTLNGIRLLCRVFFSLFWVGKVDWKKGRTFVSSKMYDRRSRPCFVMPKRKEKCLILHYFTSLLLKWWSFDSNLVYIKLFIYYNLQPQVFNELLK